MSAFNLAMTRGGGQAPPPLTSLSSGGQSAAMLSGLTAGQFQLFLDNAWTTPSTSPPPAKEVSAPPERESEPVEEAEAAPVKKKGKAAPMEEVPLAAWTPLTPVTETSPSALPVTLDGELGAQEGDTAEAVLTEMAAGEEVALPVGGIALATSAPASRGQTSVEWFANQWQGVKGWETEAGEGGEMLLNQQMTAALAEVSEVATVTATSLDTAALATGATVVTSPMQQMVAAQTTFLERNRQVFLDMAASQRASGGEGAAAAREGGASPAQPATGGDNLVEMVKAVNQLQTVRGVAPPATGEPLPMPQINLVAQAPLFAAPPEGGAVTGGNDHAMAPGVVGATARGGWTPPAAQRAPVMRPEAADFAEELAGRVGRLRIISRPGQSEQLRVTLDPQELGEMTLRMRVDEENRVHLSIHTGTEAAKEVLTQQLSQLRDALARQDLGFGEVFVQVGSEGRGQWAGGEPQGRGGESAASGGHGQEKQIAPVIATPRAAPGRVSIMA